MAVLQKESICQIALVVRDIETAAKRYAELFGVDVPEIFMIPPPDEARTTYRGNPTNTRAKLAVFDLGSIVLELTEPDNEPSSWKEFVDQNGEGVHHIGFIVRDRDEIMNRFRKMGISVRQYGEYPGGSYTFVDSGEQFGVIFNIKHEPNGVEQENA